MHRCSLSWPRLPAWPHAGGVAAGPRTQGLAEVTGARRNKEQAVDVMLTANCSSPKDFFPSSKAWCLALLCSWEFADAVVQAEQAEVGS